MFLCILHQIKILTDIQNDFFKKLNFILKVGGNTITYYSVLNGCILLVAFGLHFFITEDKRRTRINELADTEDAHTRKFSYH